MSIDFTLLAPDFAATAHELVAACAKRGHEVRPYMGLRTPVEQARLWRQGRTLVEIHATLDKLRAGGAPMLARVIGAVGPQHGPRVTGAWPGASWHQWGEAMDCFPVGPHGEAAWDDAAAWACYGAEAERLGLTWGRAWGDDPHVQARGFEPTKWTLTRIEAQMVERFPTLKKA